MSEFHQLKGLKKDTKNGDIFIFGNTYRAMMDLKSEKKYVKSVSEYIDTILLKKENLNTKGEIWFRGHGSEKFELIPSLYRKVLHLESRKNNTPVNTGAIYQVEQNIDMSFSRKASMFLNKSGIKDSPWNRYFLKQHYQVHTRLLDWTENALVALFFALTDNSVKNENAKVLLLDPFKLNNYTVRKILKDTKKSFYHILSCGELPKKSELRNEAGQIKYSELLRKYYRLDCESEEELYPIAIYPQHLDERMASQQACFTMFGNMPKGFELQDSKEPIIDSILISSEHKDQMINELKLLGINYYFVFPDLDGLGKAINEESYGWFKDSREGDSWFNILASG